MELNLPDLTGKALSLIQGEEKRLRLRQQHARFGIVVAVGGLALQLLITLFGKTDLKTLGQFLNEVLRLDFHRLTQNGALVPELTAFLAIFGGLASYMLLRWTGFLLRESREPFRYTFHIEDFARVADTPPATRFVLENEDRFKLLSHDLIERLNQRIRRLSVLEGDAANNQEAAATLGSHIAIKGHYAIREVEKDTWIIEVMPRVRIGPAESPWTLSPPVKYPLNVEEPKFALDADSYNQIVERVHSAVATEVYRQIEIDVRNKITVFPTAYLRAVALGYEAEDFARSNTVDAYDRAIDLYRQAIRYFNVANVRPITAFLIRSRFGWRKDVHFVQTHARVVVGYSKALIYRRKLSALTGRYLNPLFEIPPLLEEVIGNLRATQRRVAGFAVAERSDANRAFLTYPEDSWLRYIRGRPSKQFFDRQRHALFDALVAAALAYFYLDAVNMASQYLEDARAIDPQRSQSDALFLLTEGEIEPALHKEILLFQRAAEVAPDFQIANYLYAYHSEMLFRAREELTAERSARVIKTYDDVLRINPGNIATLAAQGYLHWLLGQNDKALRKFEQGRELKSIIRETFVGVLNYGLARVAAEQGKFNECYDRYTEAVAADPGVAAYSTDPRGRTNGAYYEYITLPILNRYKNFADGVSRLLDEVAVSGKDKNAESCSERTRQTVRSFVLNDYATARFNFYLRTGDEDELNGALTTYQDAVAADLNNATAYYNLASAQMMKGGDQDAPLANFAKAEARAPSWPTVLTATAKAALEAITRIIGGMEEKRNDLVARHKENLRHVTQERRIKQRRSLDDAAVMENAPADENNRQSAEGIAEIQERLEREHAKQLKDIDDAIKLQRGRIDTDVATRLARAFERTRFGPLLAGSGVGAQPVNRLLSMPIERARIDENDIETLRLLSAVLARDDDDQKVNAERRAAGRLCEFLSQYYPEDFDRDLLMHDMYVRTGNTHAAAERRARIKAAVTRSLDIDPASFVAFTWLSGVRAGFTMVDIKKRLEAAVEFAPASPAAYYVLAGDAYFAAEKWPDAIREYRMAVTPAPRSADHANRLANTYYRNSNFEEARQWYDAAIQLAPGDEVFHGNLGGALRQLKRWPESAAAYTKARELAPQNDSLRFGLRNVYNEWGNELSYAGDEKEAVAKYEAAIALDPDDAVIRSNLSSSLAALREPGKEQACLDQAIVQLEKAAELSKDTTEYRRRLDDLRLKRRVAARFGVHTLERLPGVTPIGMDIAEDLARLVSDATVSGLSATAEALTSAMRERVQGELGVRLPGVRYRKNTDLPAGIYVLMLNEVPYGSGATPVDKRFTPASRARLTGLNVPVEEAERPDGGGTGFWITEPYWPNVATQDELWEILEWPVRHLEQLVRRNLPLYFGHQEATYLLRENGGPAAKDILEDGQKLTALVITLRALVSEEVPIVALTPILDRFLELYAKDMKPHDIVEQLRLLPDLRAHLPGVGARIALHRLGDRFEERIQRAMSSDNGRFVLALLPDDCQALLTAVREQARNRPSALIVSNPALRPFVRKLVQLEFPELSVLAAEELQAGVLQQGLPMVEIPQ